MSRRTHGPTKSSDFPSEGKRSGSSSATLRLAGCCRNTEFLEKTEPGEAYDVCVKNAFRVDSEGFAQVSTGPELGLDFDLDEISRRTIMTA